MTSLDAGVLVLFLLFLIRGVWIGLVRQLASIAALFFGFVAAGRYYQQLGRFLEAYVPWPQIVFLLTFGLLFLIVYLVTIGVGFGLKKVMSVSFLGWFDRMMGGVFGVGKAVILSTVLFMVLTGFLAASSPLLNRSLLAPYLKTSSRFFLTFIKDRKLQRQFLPHDPAISSIFALPVPAGQAKRRHPQEMSQ